MISIISTLLSLISVNTSFANGSVNLQCLGHTSLNKQIEFKLEYSDWARELGYQSQTLQDIKIEGMPVDSIDLLHTGSPCKSINGATANRIQKYLHSNDEFNYESSCDGQNVLSFHAICSPSDKVNMCYEPYLPLTDFDKISKWNQIFNQNSDQQVIRAASALSDLIGLPIVVNGKSNFSRLSVESDSFQEIKFYKNFPLDFTQLAPKIEIYKDKDFTELLKSIPALSGSSWNIDALHAMSDLDAGFVYYKTVLKPISPICKPSDRAVPAIYSLATDNRPRSKTLGLADLFSANLTKVEVACPDSLDERRCYQMTINNDLLGSESFYAIVNRY